MDLEGVSTKNLSLPRKEGVRDLGKGWWIGDSKPEGEDSMKGVIITEVR